MAMSRIVKRLAGVKLGLNDVLGIADVEVILFFGTKVVAVAEHGSGFLSGHFYGVLRYRRAEDIVKPGNAFELLLGRRVGNDDCVVLILTGKRQTFWQERRDNFTGKVANADHFANRIFDAKELIPDSAAKRAYVRGAVDVILGKYRALIHVPTLYLEVFRRDAAVGRVPVLVAVDYLDWVVDVRRNALDE